MPNDALVNVARVNAMLVWLAAASITRYVLYVRAQRSRSVLEQRMLVLLYCMGAYFVLRGVHELAPGRWTATMAVAPVTLLPLAATLLVEGMLRRHVPLALKVWASAGALVLFAWNLMPGGRSNVFLVPFAGYVIVTLASLAVLMLVRDRSDVSPFENRFIDTACVACVVGEALALTDLGLRPSWSPYGLSGLGGLIWVHCSVRQTGARERKLVVFAEVGRFMLHAAAITTVFAVLVPRAPLQVTLLIFVMSWSFVLLLNTIGRIRALRMQHRAEGSFARWLVDVPARTVEEFCESLRHAPWAADPLVLTGRSLEGYDECAVASALASSLAPGGAGTLATLRRAESGDASPPSKGMCHGESTFVPPVRLRHARTTAGPEPRGRDRQRGPPGVADRE